MGQTAECRHRKESINLKIKTPKPPSEQQRETDQKTKTKKTENNKQITEVRPSALWAYGAVIKMF